MAWGGFYFRRVGASYVLLSSNFLVSGKPLSHLSLCLTLRPPLGSFWFGYFYRAFPPSSLPLSDHRTPPQYFCPLLIIHYRPLSGFGLEFVIPSRAFSLSLIRACILLSATGTATTLSTTAATTAAQTKTTETISSSSSSSSRSESNQTKPCLTRERCGRREA